jgi:Na+/H+-translocating membrane pyrophosphatase
MSAILFLGVAIGSGLLSIFVSLYIFYMVNKADEGSEKMREVSALIEDGAYSFIKVQYRILTIFTNCNLLLLGFVSQHGSWIHWSHSGNQGESSNSSSGSLRRA